MRKKGFLQHKITGMGKRATALGLALLFGLAAVGCGGSNKETQYASGATADTAAYDGGLYEMANAVEAPEEEGVAEEGAETVTQNNRKLIRNVDMSVETENFDGLLEQVRSRVEALGGYIENSSVYNGSYTSDYQSRNASVTARIPSGRLDEFLDTLEDATNVVRKNETVEDVTLQYVDLESHKKALQAEQESLLSMLEHAESIEDIIAINEQLTDVRYRLESMESQLRTYDNKIDYSTVYLDIQEVEHYVPAAKKSAGERIREGFVNNLRRAVSGVMEFFIELIIALPLLVVAAVVIALIVLAVMLLVRISEKQAAKKRERLKQQGVVLNRYGSRVAVGKSAPQQGAAAQAEAQPSGEKPSGDVKKPGNED